MDHKSAWRTLREATGLGLREVARRAGIHPAYMSMIETGRMVATPDESRRILSVLDEAGPRDDRAPVEIEAAS